MTAAGKEPGQCPACGVVVAFSIARYERCPHCVLVERVAALERLLKTMESRERINRGLYP
jgi:hypothetical protein